MCVGNSLRAEATLQLVFKSQHLSTSFVDRLGELYVDGYFFSYVRERVARNGVDVLPILPEGNLMIHLTKSGDLMTGELRRVGQEVPLVAIATDSAEGDGAGILLTRSPNGSPPEDSSLMFKFFELLGVQSEGKFPVEVISWIDGRVVRLSAFPIFVAGADKSNRNDLDKQKFPPSGEKFTPGLKINDPENFNWATKSPGTVSFYLPKGVAGLQFEYVSKAFTPVSPGANERHETGDTTLMKFKLNAFETFREYSSVKDSSPYTDFVLANRDNSQEGIPPSDAELQAVNAEISLGSTARVELANGVVEKWRYASEWQLTESYDAISHHRWFYQPVNTGKVTFREGENRLVLTPVGEAVSIQRINVSYFIPFPRTQWKSGDRTLTLRCTSPLSQVIFSDTSFAPVEVDRNRFLISWQATGFKKDAENSEGFYIELHAQYESLPNTTYTLAVRENDVRESGPTAAELEAANGAGVTPSAGNTARVTLRDGTIELWTFDSAWKLSSTLEPDGRYLLCRQVTPPLQQEAPENQQNTNKERTIELKFSGKIDAANGLDVYKVSPYENVNDGQTGYVVVDLPRNIVSARVEFKREAKIK